MTATNFGGMIGRTWRESKAWWPEPPARPPGAPNVMLVVLDDVGYAQLGCFGSDIDTPNLDRLAARRRAAGELPHHRAVLADPGLPADRPQPPLQRHGPHHRPGHRVPRLLGTHPARQRLPRRDPRPGRVPAGCGREVAPHSGGGDPPGRRTAAIVAVPAGASSAGTGSTAARPTSSCRRCSRTTTRSSRPASPEHGYHLSEDLADRAIRYLGDLRSADPDKPLFLYFATGRLPLAPPRAPPVDRPLRRAVRRRLGRVAPTRSSPASWRWACSPRGPSCRRARLGAGLGRRSAPRTRRVSARFMECFAGFLSHADAQIGRVFDFLRPARRVGQHARDRRSPTTAPAPRAARSGRSTTSACGTPSLPAPRSCAPAWTSSAARAPTTTTPGAGPWPATRRSGAGSGRCTRAGSPTRASSRGRPACGPGARCADSSRTPSTSLPTVLDLIGLDPPAEIRGVAQINHRRRQLRRTSCSDGAAPETHHTQYFEMLGSRGIYHDGWKAVTFHPFVDLYHEGGTRTRPSTTTGGSSTTSPRTPPKWTTWPTPSRNGWRPWSTCGGARREVPGSSARQPPAGSPPRPAAGRRPSATARWCGRSAHPCPRSGWSGCATGRTR